jgi:hypothetical protein
MGSQRPEVVGRAFSGTLDAATLRRLAVAASFAAAILLVASRADAYRPFDGTDADTVTPGVLELQVGPVQYRLRGSQNALDVPALLLNVGIVEKTEVVAEADQQAALGKLQPGVERVSLLRDDILLKHVFRTGTLHGEEGIAFAAAAGVLVPEVHGRDGVGGTIDGIVSYRWYWGTLHWNEWLQYNRDHHAELFSSLIVEGPHDWVVRPVAEFVFDKDFVAGQTTSLLAGAIWSIDGSLAFDVAARGSVVFAQYGAEVRLGLTWAIPVTPRAERPAQREGL